MVLLGKIEGVKREPVDDLTGSISKQQPLPTYGILASMQRKQFDLHTLESEEDEEGEVVFLLRGVVDASKETEMIV